MKLVFAFVAAVMSQTDPMETTTLPAHSPEAQDYCHNACKGTGNQLSNGNCKDGFYASPINCSDYYVCWDQGKFIKVSQPAFFWTIVFRLKKFQVPVISFKVD